MHQNYIINSLVVVTYFIVENCSFAVHFTLNQTGVLFLVTRQIRNFYDLKTIGYFAPLHEIFFQVESDFNRNFVNLKPTTEVQEAMNITCSHKDN